MWQKMAWQVVGKGHRHGRQVEKVQKWNVQSQPPRKLNSNLRQGQGKMGKRSSPNLRRSAKSNKNKRQWQCTRCTQGRWQVTKGMQKANMACRHAGRHGEISQGARNPKARVAIGGKGEGKWGRRVMQVEWAGGGSIGVSPKFGVYSREGKGQIFILFLPHRGRCGAGNKVRGGKGREGGRSPLQWEVGSPSPSHLHPCQVPRVTFPNVQREISSF